jgi:hypothetical protein
MKKYILILFLLVFLLPSCGEPIAINTPASIANTPTVTNLPYKITSTPQLPTVKPQQTSTPTLTPNPTIQFESTRYQQTQIASEIEAQATTQAMETFREIFTGVCDAASFETSLSPSGNWLAQECPTGEFQVIKKNDLTIWVVEDEQVFENIDHVGNIFPVFWTKNDEYLYFSRFDCCADNDTMSNGNMLYRMDLKTGKWKMIIGGYFNYYSFSPTGRRLLYALNDQALTGKPRVIHIIDIISGTETKFEFPDFEQVGNIVWRKDGLQAALTAKTGNRYRENELFSIVIIDIKEYSSKAIIRDSKEEISVVKWSDDDILMIEKYTHSGTVEQTYYDLNLQRLVTLTPTE